MDTQESVKKERKEVIFDSICSIISASIAIGGIIVTTLLGKAHIGSSYFLGLGFWIVWLIISGLFILYEVRAYHHNLHYYELHHEEETKKKNLKAPIMYRIMRTIKYIDQIK
ncbi:MAG: hypothetical protein P8Y97_16580 [Candidatus Lokiarchaeota archaeon]